jgi:hypothetical protein
MMQLTPIQQAVQLHLQHVYSHNFPDVANAFLLKYNIENRFCYTTIASSRQIDEDRFEIVRRMENTMSSRPVYERIIFNRSDQSVSGYTFETNEDKAYVEHYVYKKDNEKTVYDMFLYKNPGLKKMLRFKLHNWGIQTMESIIKKEQEIAAKLREKEQEISKAIKERKDAIMERKDKLVMDAETFVEEKKVILKEKFNEIIITTKKADDK